MKTIETSPAEPEQEIVEMKKTPSAIVYMLIMK